MPMARRLPPPLSTLPLSVLLARLLVDCRPALAFNRVFDDPGLVIFEHACKLGCKGIVSKRRGSRYAGGRSSNWLTVKNPGALAVRDGQEGRRALEQMSPLILRRTSESHPDDYSVFHESQRVGRIYRMQSTDRELWYWTEIGAHAPNAGLADTLEAAETDFPQRLEDARVSQGENPAAPAGRKTGGALAEYYPLIVGAADGLESSTPESRRAFYDRIRSVLAAQLGKFDPPISESDLSVERQAREKAIQMVEALASAKEHAVSDAKIVADYASFAEKTRIRIDCFYGTNLLPHPKQAIIAAIWRQIVQESSDARVEWLRAARTFLWNFVEGADATPVPPMVVDLDRLRRDSAPELVVQQIVTQFCAIEDECNEPFRVIAKREDKQIKALITAAIDIRNELLIAMRSVNDASGDLLTRSGYATDQARGVEAMARPGKETIEPSKELIRAIEELLARAALKQRTLTRRPGSGSPARAARQPRWDDYRGY